MMKKPSKLLGIGVLVLMLAPALVGCIKGGNTEAGDKVTLKVAVDVTKTEVNIIEKLIEGFEANNKDVSLKVVKITQGYDSYIQKNFDQGKVKSTIADIISVYDYNSEYWTSMNLFKPLTSYMTRDDVNENNYVSSMFALGKSGQEGDNNYYWLPRDYNKVVVCYNTEIFEAAGIAKPSNDWTMEDFNNICKTLLEKKDIIKAKTGTYDFWPAEMNIKWTAVYYPWIKSYGGDFLADDGTMFKNPDKVKQSVLELLHYADASDGKKYQGLGYSNPIGQSSDQANFVNKKAAMTFTVRPNVKSFADSLKNNIDFVSLPKITDNAEKVSYIGAGCTGYGITAGCPDEKMDAAWRFLKYVISKEGQEVMGETGSGVPVLQSLLNDPNAKWNNFISKDLNHSAFTAFPERDLSMNYVHGFKLSKQLTVYKELKDNFIYSMYNTNDRDNEFNAFKSKIDKTLA